MANSSGIRPPSGVPPVPGDRRVPQANRDCSARNSFRRSERRAPLHQFAPSRIARFRVSSGVVGEVDYSLVKRVARELVLWNILERTAGSPTSSWSATRGLRAQENLRPRAGPPHLNPARVGALASSCEAGTHGPFPRCDALLDPIVVLELVHQLVQWP